MNFTHEDLIAIGHQLQKGFFQVSGDELTFETGYVPTKAEMDAALLAYKKKIKTAEIDDKFEAIRQEYLSSGATMSMVYKLKSEQAKAYKLDPNGTYAMLQASVTAGEATGLNEAADIILAKEAALIQIASQLEAARLAKKIAVGNATTLEGLDAI